MSFTAGMLKHENYVVIGGSGFLGSYIMMIIVQPLIDRSEPSVAVYDINLPNEEDVIEWCHLLCWRYS